MEPYVFRNGDTWGEDRPAEIKPPKSKHPLGARVRRRRQRARTDPGWAALSERSRARLVEIDLDEGR